MSSRHSLQLIKSVQENVAPRQSGDDYLTTNHLDLEEVSAHHGCMMNTSHVIRDNDYRLLNCLEDLNNGNNPADPYRLLPKIKTLVATCNTDIRLTVFRKLNHFIQQNCRRFAKTRGLFQLCAETTLTLRNQMQSNKQELGHIAKMEWVELEKAVYYLSLWEEIISQFDGNALSANH